MLAELCRRELVPATWLPGPEVRAQRELARFRHYLVRYRTSLTNRIHVDPVGLRGERSQSFRLHRVGDLDIPAAALQGVVCRAGRRR